MTVLRFDGTDDRVIFPIGSFNGMAGGPITYGVLYRTDDIAVTRTILEIGVNAGGRIGLGVSSGDFFRFFNGGSTRDGPTTPSGWFLCVTTKASGSVAPRYHVYDFTAGTWSHGAQGAATANQTLGNGEVRFGENLAAGNDWTGDIGLGFLANVELSDAAVEAMTTNRKTSDIWTAIGGASTFDLWELISGSAITSLGGSAETSRTGTTTTSESIPGGWTFDGVGGGGAVTITAASETDAAQALTFTKTIFKTLTAPSQTSAAQALNVDKTVSLVAAAESDSARTLTFTKTIVKTLTAAAETAAAQVLSVTKTIFKSLTAAGETDAAQLLDVSGPTVINLTPAVETDSARPLSVTKTIFKTLAPAGETAAAQAVMAAHQLGIVSATTSQAAQPLTKTKTVTFVPAVEVDAAQAVQVVKTIYKTLAPGLEVDVAVALDFLGGGSLRTAHLGPHTPAGGIGQGSPSAAVYGPPSPSQVRV